MLNDSLNLFPWILTVWLAQAVIRDRSFRQARHDWYTRQKQRRT